MTRTDRKPDKIDLTEVLGPDQGPAADSGDVEILDSEAGPAGKPARAGSGEPRGDAPADAERERLQDLYVRTRADFDNFRKRVERERAEERARAAASLMQEILPVMDNLERALASAPEGDPLREGVVLIHRQLSEALGRAGLEPIAAQGEPFDPLYHDAVAAEPTDACEPNTVLEVIQKGYKLSGRVLRPAIVRVSAPARGTEPRLAETGGAEGDQEE